MKYRVQKEGLFCMDTNGVNMRLRLEDIGGIS